MQVLIIEILLLEKKVLTIRILIVGLTTKK